MMIHINKFILTRFIRLCRRPRACPWGSIILFCLLYFIVYPCDGRDTNADTIINIHYARSVRFYKDAQYDKAVKELERILEIDPQHIKAQKFLAVVVKRRSKVIVYQLYDEAKKYYKQKDYQKALETYQEVLEIIPSDGYAQYNIELLKARIEKLEQIKQRKEKFHSISKEKSARKQARAKQKIVWELARREKEIQRKRIRKNAKDISKQYREQKEISSENRSDTIDETELQESEKVANIKTDLDKVEHLRSEKDKEFLSKLDSLILDKKREVAYLSEELSEQEKLVKVKSLYASGKVHYKKANYLIAIEEFEQVIDIENNRRSRYTHYAKKYIAKAKEKFDRQIQKEKLKQIKEIEKEMIDKITKEAKSLN